MPTKHYYLYLLLNEYVNIAHIQEVPISTECIESGLSEDEIKEAKNKLSNNKKIVYYKDYVYLCNAHKYVNYAGIKNDHLKLRILYEMSDDVLKNMKVAVINTISDVRLDIANSKNTDMKISEKVSNLFSRLYNRLNFLGIDIPSDTPMPIEVVDTPIPIEGRIQNTEYRKQKLEIINSTSKEIVTSNTKLNSSKRCTKGNEDINKAVEHWKKTFGKNPPSKLTLSRYPFKRLIDAYTLDHVLSAITVVGQSVDDKYAPSINNPKDLEDKWISLIKYYKSKKRGVEI
ncbi:MAG TPA: hypothetical protein PLV82_02625 [bacterium]|nr:hypothetical protein [bacterium]